MYIVIISSGSYDSYHERNLFVTHDKSYADQYSARLNDIVDRWCEYYSKFEKPDSLLDGWIMDEHSEKYFDRWYRLKEFNQCYVEEIQER